MKTNKRGISLIVLVITVIVLGILATAVIIRVGDTDIIDRANEAVDEYNLATYQEQLTLAYASWFADNQGSTLTDISELAEHGFDASTLPSNLEAVISNGLPKIQEK